jgi:hypothetical protein
LPATSSRRASPRTPRRSAMAPLCPATGPRTSPGRWSCGSGVEVGPPVGGHASGSWYDAHVAVGATVEGYYSPQRNAYRMYMDL